LSAVQMHAAGVRVPFVVSGYPPCNFLLHIYNARLENAPC
jgi:hypothetical protein